MNLDTNTRKLVRTGYSEELIVSNCGGNIFVESLGKNLIFRMAVEKGTNKFINI